ncbi:MAG TPA: hypothetical protein VK116_03110 [Planctomycetota bacterium]|nr:hypothetical protein [Planctomycetota bacterium]
MDHATDKLLRWLLDNAIVKDFDFSKWDRYVRLVVIGRRLKPIAEDPGTPVFNIDFHDAVHIEWESHHTKVMLDDPEWHCQWNILDYSIEHEDGHYSIALSSIASPGTNVRIRCRDIAISRLPDAMLEAVNPNWLKRGVPLARPSIEELYYWRRRQGQLQSQSDANDARGPTGAEALPTGTAKRETPRAFARWLERLTRRATRARRRGSSP